METVTGEHACYQLLAFISLKMELHWRSNPVGKVRNNLPFFKELAYDKFTQKKLTVPFYPASMYLPSPNCHVLSLSILL